MRLLVTRPIAQSQTLAAKLRALGHDAVVAPLMTVRVIDGPTLSLAGIQAAVLTSANGARALGERSRMRDVPVFAVGPQTAEAARALGFARVSSAEGDAASLAEFIAARLDPQGGALFHAAGAETAGRLRRLLEAAGFAVESEVLYAAEPVPELAREAASALKGGALDGVLVFSPRSARILAGLVTRAGLAPACARLDAFCISAAAAEALSPLGFARVLVAGAPNETAMLALISPGRVA
jgi:uroporphyrinogen-III synthase